MIQWRGIPEFNAALQRMAANVDIGTRTSVAAPMPLALIAVTSLSAASRLRPIRIPTSTPKGTVNGSTGGSASANNQPTVSSFAELRTNSSKYLSTRCRKMTKVASSVPNRALATISRKT